MCISATPHLGTSFPLFHAFHAFLEERSKFYFPSESPLAALHIRQPLHYSNNQQFTRSKALPWECLISYPVRRSDIYPIFRSLSGSGTACWLQAAALAAGNMDPLYPGKAMQMQLCRSVVLLKWASAWGMATKRTPRRWLVSRFNFLFVDLFVFYGKHER